MLLLWWPALALAAGGTAAPEPLAVLTISGNIALPAAPLRPAQGQLVVELRDTHADRVLAEQRMPLEATAAMQAFQLRLPHDRVPRQALLAVRAALLDRGGPAWLSEPVAIDTATSPVDLATLHLARAPRPLAFQTRIDCGLRQFVIGMDGDTMTLRDGPQSFALRPSTLDPDRHLEAAGDVATYVHTTGTSATVAVRGLIYAGCSLLR
jgi:hypothetical protein